MYLDYATKTLNTMINLKKDKDYIDYDLRSVNKINFLSRNLGIKV